MWNRVQKHLPQFSLAGLLWFASAVAIGIAINQVKSDGSFADDSSFSELLYSGADIAAVLIVYELVRQCWQMQRRNIDTVPVPFEWRFATWLRGCLAIGIAGLLLVKMLVNQRIITLAENQESILRPVQLWPGTLLTLLVLMAMRLMVQHPIRMIGHRFRRAISALFVGAAMVLIGLYTLTDRLFISWLVHIAMDGVEKSHAVHWHRAGVYPHHASEGFFSFWSSCAALLVVATATASLLVAACVRRRLSAACCWLCFTAGVVAAGRYAFWFATQELPRISPDMMERQLPASGRELISGLVVLVGLAAILGYRLATIKSRKQSTSLPRPVPRPAGLMAIAAAILALGVWGVIAEHLEAFVPSSFFWTIHENYWLHAIGSVVMNILWSASMISIAVVVSGMTLLWQYYRPIEEARTLRPLNGRDLALYTLATLVLLVVAIPTFAAFGFCYWLGPWVL